MNISQVRFVTLLSLCLSLQSNAIGSEHAAIIPSKQNIWDVCTIENQVSEVYRAGLDEFDKYRDGEGNIYMAKRCFDISGGFKNSASLSEQAEKIIKADKIRVIQKQLDLLGYESGGVDGIFGPKTKISLSRFRDKYISDNEGIEYQLNGVSLLDNHMFRLDIATGFFSSIIPKGDLQFTWSREGNNVEETNMIFSAFGNWCGPSKPWNSDVPDIATLISQHEEYIMSEFNEFDVFLDIQRKFDFETAGFITRYLMNEPLPWQASGNNPEPTGILDSVCRQHDLCYRKNEGDDRCECDREMVSNIETNFNYFSPNELSFSHIFKEIFESKSNSDSCKGGN